MTTGERMRDRRKELGLTAEEVAAHLNVSRATIYRYEKGDIEKLPIDILKPLSEILSTTEEYLMGWTDDPIDYDAPDITSDIPLEILQAFAGDPEAAYKAHKAAQDESQDNAQREQLFNKFDNLSRITKKKFPLLGEIACGEPIYANEDHESYVIAGTDIKADFCLRAKGDSMIGARIMDGDVVFIREQSMVDDGQIAAVIVEDEATLKRVYYEQDKNRLTLQAENPRFKPLIYSGEELNRIRILGLAVAFQSDVH